MTELEVLEILEDVGAVIEGHFVLTSGKHADRYINKDAVYPHTRLISKLCLEIARRAARLGDVIDVVIGPAIGGVILSQWVADHLSDLTGKEILSVYAEKSPPSDVFVIKRGYDELVRGKNVLAVEDIFTTGGSARKVVDAARNGGGTVVAVAGLCNRGEVDKKQVGNPPHFFTLASLSGLKAATWDAFRCPMCAIGVPIYTKLGKGSQFLADQQARNDGTAM